MDDLDRMMALRQQGYYCSQIILLLGLEMQGKDNPDLVRSMHALAGGIGFTGQTCGALTGAACLIGLYAGKGRQSDSEDGRLMLMAAELVDWFKDTYGSRYGGIQCDDILEGNPHNLGIRCPEIVSGAYQKVKDLLVENGYDLSGLE